MHLKIYKKTIITYLIISVFCVIYNYTYSYLGHGVISNTMKTTFLYPLLMGTFLYIILDYKNIFNRVSFNFYNAGIATLTVGGLYQGIIDVSGADTNYYKYYLIIGILLIIFSLINLIFIKK